MTTKWTEAASQGARFMANQRYRAEFWSSPLESAYLLGSTQIEAENDRLAWERARTLAKRMNAPDFNLVALDRNSQFIASAADCQKS